MSELSKLQIRAKVLSVISEIKTINSFNEETLNKYINELKEINDRNTLFDIFLKEFIKLSEKEYMFSSLLLKELVSADYIQEKVFDILKSNAYSDEAKYKLVQLLRVIGSNSAYDTIPQYFENPDEVLDLETQKLLDNASVNPEAMLDFLDFVYAVPNNDKKLLLASLKEDYQGDMLANIIYPILYSNFDDDFKLDVIDVLAESKSALAIDAFEYLMKISENEQIINACALGLKKIKFAGATVEKATQYFQNAIKEVKPAEFYTTIPDGNGNQALLISRVNNTKKYVFGAVVINDNFGIIDCFGFYDISQNEFEKIVNKFYKSDGKYQVCAEYIKTRINEALDVSIKNKKTLPYEFICWNILTKDIAPLEISIKDFVDNNVKTKQLTKDELLELLTKDYTLRWFVNTDESEILKRTVNEIYSKTELDDEYLKQCHNTVLNELFNEENINIWKNNLYNLIYLLYTNSEEENASEFYTMLKDEKLFNLFKSVLVQRSIFNHFVTLKENLKQLESTVNIFKKKVASNSEYKIDKVQNIIDYLEKSWLDE